MSHRLGETLAERAYAQGVLLGKLYCSRRLLLELLTDRFGLVSDEVLLRIEGCTDLEKLRVAMLQSHRVANPEEIPLDGPAPANGTTAPPPPTE